MGKHRKRWWGRLGLTALGLVAFGYGGLLMYAKQQFGASPAEVNGFLNHWLIGKGRLKPASPPAPAATRNGRWAQDLTYLRTELPRLHANAFHTVSQVHWDSQLDGLSARIPTLTDAQLTVGVLALVAAIGDGHTNVMPWSYADGLPRSPVRLRWYGDELRVVQATDSGRPFLGSRVQEIGGVSAAEAIRQALSVSAGDSDWDKQGRASGLVLFAAVQEYLKLKPGAFVFQKPNGEEVSVQLKAIITP